MKLTTVLTIVAAQTVNQFWADISSMREELIRMRERITNIEVVCGMVEVRIPDRIPEYNLQCDPIYPDEKGDE